MNTETITFDNDISVICVTADSFPEGITAAYNKLNTLITLSGRKIFGLSRLENGVIVYKAAAEETAAGEGEKLGLETIVLKKGEYISHTINDFMLNIPSIGESFKELISNPGIDPDGYCVEWYFNNKDVRCMIRMA